MVLDEPVLVVRVVLVSSSACPVTRRCNGGDALDRDDSIGDDADLKGGGGAGTDDDEPAVVYGG